MATFASWLKDQQPRTDAVGWFATYWDKLSPKPRLSSPSSIGSHLEDRETGGFRDSMIGLADGTSVTGTQLRDAYDAVLTEYRGVRSQTVEAARAASGYEQPQLPLSDDPELSPGQIVDRATAAATEAGRAHPVTSPSIEGWNTEALLIHIARGVELIQLALGIARDEDGQIVRFPPAAGMPNEVLNWPELYALADLTAEAE